MAPERVDHGKGYEESSSSEKNKNTFSDIKNATPSNPAFQLNSSDNPGTPLVAAVLNGENYRTWARSMKTAL